VNLRLSVVESERACLEWCTRWSSASWAFRYRRVIDGTRLWGAHVVAAWPRDPVARLVPNGIHWIRPFLTV
jgi:hypothetical protein